MKERLEGIEYPVDEDMNLRPYHHDCINCVWVGWIHWPGSRIPGNIYLCGKTVVIRLSDVGSDYFSSTAGELVKCDINASKEEAEAIIQRRNWYAIEDEEVGGENG